MSLQPALPHQRMATQASNLRKEGTVMENHGRTLGRRYDALRLRIDVLASARRLIDLPPESDIAPAQWTAIESQLGASRARLSARLNRAGRAYLTQTTDLRAARALNAILGEIELELAEAFVLFDTYVDILTQRHAPELSGLLAGCDALARDAIQRDHPALVIVEAPLVSCDRGFGARTMREGVLTPGGIRNPVPIIQIPYSRLKEKYNLTSVLHEIGHEVMVRLGLVASMPRALRAALKRAGASTELQNYYALWAFELGPDFWAFCGSGIAAARGISEVLALPPSHAYRITWTDPHPPPYLRSLINFECCRQVWGLGPWNRWEAEWTELYRLEDAAPSELLVLHEARALVPVVARALLTTRYRALSGRSIPDLFDLPALAPDRLARFVRQAEAGTVTFPTVSPAAQLGIFRLVKERGTLDETKLDELMSRWLLGLGASTQVTLKKGG